jgi:hypothetical protein
VRYLDTEVATMLRGTYSGAVGTELFSASALLTRLVGWMAYDVGVHGMAQRYFVQALRLAQASGDRTLGAYILASMSRQAVYLGHGREAVQLARVAQQGALSVASPRVRVVLHAVEARGHGLLGDGRACMAALVRADQALGQAGSVAEEPDWARFVDEAQLADEYAHCFRDLEDHRRAREFAERSLKLRDMEYARSRLFCSTVLATALLGLGELDRACAIEAQAAEAAGGMRSARAVEYVRDFSMRLTPYKDTPAVRDFRRRTDDFLRVS